MYWYDRTVLEYRHECVADMVARPTSHFARSVVCRVPFLSVFKITKNIPHTRVTRDTSPAMTRHDQHKRHQRACSAVGPADARCLQHTLDTEATSTHAERAASDTPTERRTTSTSTHMTYTAVGCCCYCCCYCCCCCCCCCCCTVPGTTYVPGMTRRAAVHLWREASPSRTACTPRSSRLGRRCPERPSDSA